MLGAVVLFMVLPTLIKCSGEGNIRLLEEEVAAALKICADSSNSSPNLQRQKRFADSAPRIDDSTKPEVNQYSHERRNSSDMKDPVLVTNASDLGINGNESDKIGDKLYNSVPRSADNESYANIDANGMNRTRRSEPLFNKPDINECLSQCVFANLQVVDSRGIPREAELWNKIQSSVMSQQSRATLKDQINACFQELQSEAEDNGCSYSNKLERCLMLRFSDRKPAGQQSNDQKQEQ